jgi:amino acid adenylation domain-containing protein
MESQKALLHELFEVKALERPYNIAVDHKGFQLSYKQLDEMTSHLAMVLEDLNVKPNKLVAIVMEKGWEQVVATLAVLKAGAAFLPIDAEENPERLAYLLDISESSVILTQAKFLNKTPWPKEKPVFAVTEATLDLHLCKKRHNKTTAKDLAYVIFTSGSTGVPKGVMISHANAVNTILDINQRFNITASDKVLAISDLTFDLAIYDIFGVLAAGGTVVIPDQKRAKDPIYWKHLVQQKKITIWDTVPALMNIFADYVLQCEENKKSEYALRLVLLSGDWIPLNLAEKIKRAFGDVETISLGGATEASIWSILYPIKNIDPDWKSIPYGKAMQNQSFHILDEEFQDVLADASGELFIGGAGVAQGYWKEPELTHTKFIKHPRLGRLYRTGDMGRYMPDGNIEFLGRKDFQVKVGGRRIETAGVEKHILKFKGVKQAVVTTAFEGHQKKLLAYVSLDYTNVENGAVLQVGEKEKQLDHWKKIYNTVFSCKEAPSDEAFNTAGWTDSNNRKIPKIEMQEWAENTKERLLSLRPSSILEVGVGTGLVFFKVAGLVSRCDATDFSKSAIAYVKGQAEKRGISNAKFTILEANKIKLLKSSYDLLVMSSVAQYFPNIEYLMEVIEQSIKRIAGKGHVFIGDVRSYPHLKAFHTARLLNKNLNKIALPIFKAALDRAIDDEDELVIHPDYFYGLKRKFTELSHVEILFKEGRHYNEMNCFRYDVILHVNQDYVSKGEVKGLDINSAEINLSDEGEFKKLLSSLTGSQVLHLKNIPNKRTCGYQLIESLKQNINWQEEFEFEYKKVFAQAVCPAKICKMAKKYNYEARLTFSEQEPVDNFDVFLYASEFESLAWQNYIVAANQKMVEKKTRTAIATFPLRPRINRKIIADLKVFLKKKLSGFSIPSHFFVVDDIPITRNGKVDRNKLLAIAQPLADKCAAPLKTTMEYNLAKIWGDILGTKIEDKELSFYEAGGSSLLFIELSLMLHKHFGVEISFGDMEPCELNIKNLCRRIEKLRSKQTDYLTETS